MTPPAMTPLFADEPPATGVDVELLVEGVLEDGGGVEDGEMGGCGAATRHDTSDPLVTENTLEDRTLFNV